MTKIFDPRITSGKWRFPKIEEFELVPVFASKKLEGTEELQSLHLRNLIFNLGPEDEKAFLAIPEMLEVVRAVVPLTGERKWVLNDDGSVVFKDGLSFLEAARNLVSAYEALIDTHGTEVEG